jgi:hypothetical protein
LSQAIFVAGASSRSQLNESYEGERQA